MTTPVIEVMAQAIYETAIDRRPLTTLGMCANYPEWGDLSDSDREHARAEAAACLKALEENITNEMLSAGWREAAGSLDFEFLDREGVRDVFTAMLRAAREE